MRMTKPSDFRARGAGRRGLRSRRTESRAVGMTLLEVLVVVSIVSMLIALLMPALGSVRRGVQTLVCSSNLKSVGMEFNLFAEGQVAAGRGDSESLRGNRFHANDFQEYLYGLDEYWKEGSLTSAPLRTEDVAMLCPAAGAVALTKQRDQPCGSGAIGPVGELSMAMNMRLYRAAVLFKGTSVLAPAASTSIGAGILDHPYVPLVLDVDGKESIARGLEPFYTAPPLGEDDAYADGSYWMPSSRHQGKTNVVFVGGHVLTSPDPQSERWDWSYQAEAGR